MTRKLVSVLLFAAHLTLLPGCQFLNWFGPSTSSDPIAVKEEYFPIKEKPANDQKSVDAKLTTNVRDEDKPKPPPFPDVPLHEVKSPAENKKTKPEGITGIVELDPPVSKPMVNETQAPIVLPTVDKKVEFEPIVMGMHFMLKGQHQEAIKCLGAYDDAKQEVLLRIMPALVILAKKKVEDLSAEEVAVLMKQFESMVDELRPRSELVVSKMVYCEDVKGYAWYRPLPENHAFLAGTQDRIGEFVQLYVELKNVASEPTKDGAFVTKLSCSLELHNEAGQRVWRKPFETNDTTLRRSARLNDFYSRHGFYVPALPAGKYRLTLHIADETNAQRRTAEKSLVFQVTPVAGLPLR
jgi:hypothetical protein